MDRATEIRYEKLSPFQLKNRLIELAKSGIEKRGEVADPLCLNFHLLNAGRGNPNFLNTTVRRAFNHLLGFAIDLADSLSPLNDVGLTVEKTGIGDKFLAYLDKSSPDPGVELLKNSLDYVEKEFKFDRDEFVLEIVDGINGDHYPTPIRIFSHTETIANKYLGQALFAGKPPKGQFDLFATEGGTAAIIYIFQTLKENKLLHPGDHIALGTPCFSPYIEIPQLNDYQLVEINIEADEDLNWQIPDTELEKLLDPRIKFFFLTNPSNPTAVSIQSSTLKAIEELVRTKRKDLIIIEDDVYATFVDDFHSLADVCPANTIIVYSFSKYFGVTGWRLGLIAMHEDNVMDQMIHKLPAKDQEALIQRYTIETLEPTALKFIDRLIIDSRDVALSHTAGLSGPQQVMICLMSLFNLMDSDQKYKKTLQSVIKKRYDYFYDNLGIDYKDDPHNTHYYTTLDLARMASVKYSEGFSTYLTKSFEPVDFLFRLAEQKATVLLPGIGFEAPRWTIRTSLANLKDEDYKACGKNVSDIMQGYFDEWNAGKK